MASSRIEIPSSSPFGCVLRDHNQRENFTSTNAKPGFRKNITELGDHFFPCINVGESITSPAAAITAALGLSPRHTRFLDRWATRQAQETASTIERKTHEAEIQALSNSQAVSSKKTSVFLRETSPALSDTSSAVEVDLLLPNVVGASSLVQMWEARTNRSNAFNSNSTNSSDSTLSVVSGDSRTNSGLSNGDVTNNNNVSCAQIDDVQEPPSRGFENGDPSEEKEENERDQRIKVSDIVKKLTSEQNNNVVRLPRIKARFAAFDQHVDQGSFLQVGKSPRIRGRQAFNDLLMQMERDRHRELETLVERHAVSRFQQHGRLQAMLRLRFLQRGVAIQKQRHLITPNNPVPREKFKIRVEHSECTVSAEDGCSSTRRIDMAMISSASSHISEENMHHHDQQHADSTRSSVTCASEVSHENSSSTSDITWQQEEAGNFEVNDNLDTQETDQHQHIWEDEDETINEQEANDDDDYDDNQQIMGSNYDWFRDICRPRVHWEGRRQAWYQEMLESDSNNGEIKQLLERKTVSTCLASDFRNRIDQLMASRFTQQTRISHRDEDEEEDSDNEERMGQLLMSFLEKHTRQASAQEINEREDNVVEDDEAEYEEKEEEEESSIGNHQYQETGDYFSQTPSSVQLPTLPSPINSSWTSTSYHDQEIGGNDDSDDQAAPTPLSFAQSPQSQSYYHQEPQIDTPSLNHRRGPSLEMELIYDLRGQMAQLHQQMSELKNTIKSCIDMQLQLQFQHSFKPENHSVQLERGEEKSTNREPKKGNCCICYETKVDSLLYRCGHMCTCLKCAHELQWSSGKCPICRAPIVDVVRAFLIPESRR